MQGPFLPVPLALRPRECFVAADSPSSAVFGVAGRYASALFDLAKERGEIETVEGDLGRFETLVNDNEDLRRLIMSPAFSAEEQVKGVMAVLDRAGDRRSRR